MKPGITGWAQVNGCSGESNNETTNRMRSALHRELVTLTRYQNHLHDPIFEKCVESGASFGVCVRFPAAPQWLHPPCSSAPSYYGGVRLLNCVSSAMAIFS
jgi:hypothetical protein